MSKYMKDLMDLHEILSNPEQFLNYDIYTCILPFLGIIVEPNTKYPPNIYY